MEQANSQLKEIEKTILKENRYFNSLRDNFDLENDKEAFEAQEEIDKCVADLEALPKAKSFGELKNNLETLKLIFCQNEKALECIYEVEVYLDRSVNESIALKLHKKLIRVLQKWATQRSGWFSELAENASENRFNFYQSASQGINIQENCNKLHEQNERQKDLIDDFINKLKSMKSEKEIESKKVSNLTGELQNKIKENSKLSESISQIKEQLENDSEKLKRSSSLEGELNIKIQENSRLTDTMLQMKEQLDQMQKDSKKLANHLSRKIQDMNTHIENLKEENKNMQIDIENLKEDQKNKQNDIENLIEDQKIKQNDIENLKEDQKNMQNDYDNKFEDLETSFEEKFQEVQNEISVIKFESTLREVIGQIRDDVCKELTVNLGANITRLDQIEDARNGAGETEQSVKEMIDYFLKEEYHIDYEFYEKLLGSRKFLNTFIHGNLIINEKELQILASNPKNTQDFEDLMELYDPIKGVAKKKEDMKQDRKSRSLCYKCGYPYSKTHHICVKCSACRAKGHAYQKCPRIERRERRKAIQQDS